MYAYFMEDGEEKHIKTNPDELVENKLASPYEALSSLDLFFPQQVSIVRASQIHDYDALKKTSIAANENIMSYCEFRPNVFFNNEEANPDDKKEKCLKDYYKYAFNECDLMPDEKRKEMHDLHIFTEKESICDLFNTPKITDSLNEFGEIFTKLNSEEMFIFPGDHFHSNEMYPWRTKRHSRHRMFRGKGKVVKYEISKDVLERLSYKGTTERILSQSCPTEYAL